MSGAPGLLLIGGSFNPPHIGHLRIALEAREILHPRKTLFIPCAHPPHKPNACLLPFDLRAEMLRASIASLSGEPGLEVSTVESDRPGPSYTVDTLAAISGLYPGYRPVFLMGGEDFAQLPFWTRWRDLTLLADLAVVPRKGYGREQFRASALAHWPQASPMAPSLVDTAFLLPDKGKALFLDQPLLEISSSLIRERFLAERSLDFLVPLCVQRTLMARQDEIRALWA